MEMKKIIYILLAGLLLTGCRGGNMPEGENIPVQEIPRRCDVDALMFARRHSLIQRLITLNLIQSPKRE